MHPPKSHPDADNPTTAPAKDAEVFGLPDLRALVAAEPDVFVLFDGRRAAGEPSARPDDAGEHLLAVGARRRLTLTEAEGALDALDAFMAADDASGWMFCTLAYDLKNGIEALQSKRQDPVEFPLLHAVEPRVVIRWGGQLSAPVIAHGAFEEDAGVWLEALGQTATTRPHTPLALRPKWDLATYRQRFARVQRHIQQGDVYELNLCQEWRADVGLDDPWGTFVRLVEETRAPHSAFVQIGGRRHALCGSPERFLRRRENELLSSPIKGTAPRSADIHEDAAIRDALQNDPKERAENVMICDLVRNDLSRVAVPASVEVTELFGIHSFATVHQMISTVRCEVRPECSLGDILRATFPMGSMTGAPKIRAMALIDEFEGVQRGLYSGTIGVVKPSGDFDFNVVIRTILHDADKPVVSVQVGGAITSAAVADQEYNECLLKARAMRKVLGDHGRE